MKIFKNCISEHVSTEAIEFYVALTECINELTVDQGNNIKDAVASILEENINTYCSVTDPDHGEFIIKIEKSSYRHPDVVKINGRYDTGWDLVIKNDQDAVMYRESIIYYDKADYPSESFPSQTEEEKVPENEYQDRKCSIHLRNGEYIEIDYKSLNSVTKDIQVIFSRRDEFIGVGNTVVARDTIQHLTVAQIKP